MRPKSASPKSVDFTLVCICMRVRKRVYVYVFACVGACLCVCACVRVCVRLYVMRMCVRVCVFIFEYNSQFQTNPPPLKKNKLRAYLNTADSLVRFKSVYIASEVKKINYSLVTKILLYNIILAWFNNGLNVLLKVAMFRYKMASEQIIVDVSGSLILNLY